MKLTIMAKIYCRTIWAVLKIGKWEDFEIMPNRSIEVFDFRTAKVRSVYGSKTLRAIVARPLIQATYKY